MIGEYRVVSRLGAGGMGTVYLARDRRGAAVAIKVIKSDLAADPEFRERFRDEVAAARRVAPFCTAQVLDADPDARRPYLVTEYIDGVRLDDVVNDTGPLPMSTLQGVAIGVASALTAIHRAGIVHRDLKPSNVMLSFSGPRVIDFGIARALDAAQGRTQTGLVIGSVGWMAPEQMEGGAPLGPAVDVFAWGLLVAYAALGASPYGEGTYQEIAEKILAGPPSLRGVPADLEPIVRAALARDPRGRPSTDRLLMTLLGQDGAPGTDSRQAATELLDGTWPKGRHEVAASSSRERVEAAAPNPTRVAGAGEQRRWWDDPTRLPPPAGPPVPPPAMAGIGAEARAARGGDPRIGAAAGQAGPSSAGGPAGLDGRGGFGGQRDFGGQGDFGGPGNPAGAPGRRRRRGGFVQYEDEQPPAARPAGKAAPARPAGEPGPAAPVNRAPAAHPRPDERRQPYPQNQPYPPQNQPYPPQNQPYPPQNQPYPQGQPYQGQPRPQAQAYPPRPEQYPPPGRPYPAGGEQHRRRPDEVAAGRREPAPRQVIERPERRGREAAPYDEPAARPRRRRRRLRIPFKKTIIFAVLVLLLLSAADQIASMVDEQRTRLWDKATTSVRNDFNDHLDSWWNQTKDTITGSSGGG